MTEIDQAVAHHRAGHLAEAEALYRQILQTQPHQPDALHLLGMLAAQSERLDEGLRLIERAIALAPGRADYLNSRGEVLRALGRLDEAAGVYRQALTLKPDHLAAQLNLANVLQGQGHLQAAIAAYRQALSLGPNDAAVHNNLGIALQASGKLAEALVHFQRARAANPQSAEICFNLGNALKAEKQPSQAIAAYRNALALKPDYPEAWNNLGTALELEGAFTEAISAYQQAITHKPDYAEAYNNLGNMLWTQGDQDLAIGCFQQALAFKPDFAEAHSNLGTAFKRQNRLTEATAAHQRSLALAPDAAYTHLNLGNALLAQGKIEEAIAHYRRAVELKTDFAEAHSSVLLALHYDAGVDPSLMLTEHRRWAQHHALPAATLIQPHANDPDRERRLRIGYVSPDFRAHSVAFFIAPILTRHDRQRGEVFCYANVRHADNVTARLRDAADHWRDIAFMSDAEVVTQIRKDRIDILVDLAGHTAHNRLCLFARKPAPIQVTYLGYPNTTGLSTMDYRLTDALADPPGKTEAFYSEELIGLPQGFLCYQPSVESPPVGRLPAPSAGYVTFASFNNATKVNQEVVRSWAGILEAVPDSRLILKASAFADEEARERLIAHFLAQGVGRQRLELIAWVSSSFKHLHHYHRVDIALDPFPYNGTTTTCEALWMGVPVITLAGETHAGRVGVSLLTRAGLPELIAESPEDYVKIAVTLASDLKRLTDLRQGLRERLQRSPLMDAAGFTRSLEQAYREMWRKYCEKSVASSEGRVARENPEASE